MQDSSLHGFMCSIMQSDYCHKSSAEYFVTYPIVAVPKILPLPYMVAQAKVHLQAICRHS